ncbi:MAG: FlgO domain-containing protein [Nitrospira sp.]|jgi:TolB-like protein|nr:MAG: FlgO domain-containing protein [Nitrospira sp.]
MIRLLPCLILLVLWHSTSLAASKYEDSVKELAEGVAAEAIKMKKSRLALLDFVDSKGDVTPIGQFLAEELATHLLVAGELKVVDRKLLIATMEKHQLTHLDTSQAKAAKKVAKALRADLYVTGAYLEIPEGIQVTAKLIGPYTVYPVGASRTIVPKSGPLAALLKQAAAPAPVTTAVVTESAPVLSAHENEMYKVTILSISRQDDQIGLDLLFTNRTAHPVKIGCQLLDTYLVDEHGEQWKQNVAHNREGLCTRGMEVNPKRQQHARLSFLATEKPPTGPITLHYHETSPRADRIITLDGLKIDTAPVSEPEVPVTQESTPPTP